MAETLTDDQVFDFLADGVHRKVVDYLAARLDEETMRRVLRPGTEPGPDGEPWPALGLYGTIADALSAFLDEEEDVWARVPSV